MAFVRELWRYPVKSLRGEQVEATVLSEGGLDGDRLVRARSLSGRRISARQFRACSGCRARPASTGHRS